MKIDVNAHAIIKVHSNYDNVGELANIEELFFTILLKVFLNRSVLLITITPDKSYSMGYSISSFQEINIGKSKFLINNINSCSSSLLMEISRSEEFSRGLLLLMTRESDLLANLEESLNYLHNNFGLENLSYETALCENDGRTLCLYNTNILKETVSLLVSNFKGNNI